MNNQRGLATLEIILVVMIIGVLSTIALPKMARMVDKAQLDYEMKIFMSTLDFVKSLNKSSFYTPGIFDSKLIQTGNVLQIDIVKKPAQYLIKSNTQNIFEPHKLPKNFSISDTLNEHIYFNKSNSGTITITSRFGDKRYIIFDSVGRWRGDIKPPSQ